MTRLLDSPVEAVLVAFVSEELLADQRTATNSDGQLMNGEGLDSLAMMRLIMFIEREFGIRIPLADVTPENFASIRTLSEYLQANPALRADS